jgi:hypothetical protein
VEGTNEEMFVWMGFVNHNFDSPHLRAEVLL